MATRKGRRSFKEIGDGKNGKVETWYKGRRLWEEKWMGYGETGRGGGTEGREGRKRQDEWERKYEKM